MILAFVPIPGTGSEFVPNRGKVGLCNTSYSILQCEKPQVKNACKYMVYLNHSENAELRLPFGLWGDLLDTRVWGAMQLYSMYIDCIHYMYYHR